MVVVVKMMLLCGFGDGDGDDDDDDQRDRDRYLTFYARSIAKGHHIRVRKKSVFLPQVQIL